MVLGRRRPRHRVGCLAQRPPARLPTRAAAAPQRPALPDAGPRGGGGGGGGGGGLDVVGGGVISGGAGEGVAVGVLLGATGDEAELQPHLPLGLPRRAAGAGFERENGCVQMV